MSRPSRNSSRKPTWWRGLVVYQIYPRSFCDSDGDGVGDLRGIIEKLDYVASLGVDAIWISPFMQSPMKDFGYDVSDYRRVDPIFGTNEDFETLIAEARRRGLAVLIDMVVAHTSDQHPWFLESASSRDNPRADWYVWADPKRDGTPPNNWLSVFGGPAWTWSAERGQYYEHNFLPSQPTLNYDQPRVLEAMLEAMRFWLERGVAGFRLDAITCMSQDPRLRDNPPRRKDARGDGSKTLRPFEWQRHVYDRDRPEILGYLEKIRSLLDRYPKTFSIAEIGDVADPIKVGARYTAGDDRLHTAYNFALLGDVTILQLAEVVKRTEKHSGGAACYSFSNHDVKRTVSRWTDAIAGPVDREPLAKLLMALLLSLPGAICIYQGEELGLPEAEVAEDLRQDPVGRDGCRTPFPWSSAKPHAGFSTAMPWLPVSPEHVELAVDRQDADPQSVLQHTRRFLRWRKDHQALLRGELSFLSAIDPIVSFCRSYQGHFLAAMFNLGPEERQAGLPAEISAWDLLEGHGFEGAELRGHSVSLPPFGAFFARSR